MRRWTTRVPLRSRPKRRNRPPISCSSHHGWKIRSPFHYNERSALGVEDAERAAKAVEGIVGKRLTYRRTDKAQDTQAASQSVFALARKREEVTMSNRAPAWQKADHEQKLELLYDATNAIAAHLGDLISSLDKLSERVRVLERAAEAQERPSHKS
jgi:hypothetical protein